METLLLTCCTESGNQRGRVGVGEGETDGHSAEAAGREDTKHTGNTARRTASAVSTGDVGAAREPHPAALLGGRLALRIAGPGTRPRSPLTPGFLGNAQRPSRHRAVTPSWANHCGLVTIWTSHLSIVTETPSL